MKFLRMALSVVLMLLATAAYPKADTASPESDAQKSFEKLKALVGTWEGQDRGKPVRIKLYVTGDGSAIVHETLSDSVGMLTVFYLDGDRLMLTHFCAAGNQPRMVGKMLPDGKTVKFDFLDGTNLNGAQSHLHSLSIILADANHHSEDFTFIQDGKEDPGVVDLHRTQ